MTGNKTTSEDLVVHLVDRKAGDYFGERALIKDEPRNADVIVRLENNEPGEGRSEVLDFAQK